MKYNIEFEPVGRRGECPSGKSLLDCARQLGVDLVNVCGGRGKCKKCKIQVLKGTVSAATTDEKDAFSLQELKKGWRLACCAYPTGHCVIHVPSESMTTVQRIQLEGQGSVVETDPAVKVCRLQLSEPSFSDLRSDSTRLTETLEKQNNLVCEKTDIEVLRDLSPRLRLYGWKAKVSVNNGEVIDVGPQDSFKLGLAVDFGTTKLAGYLVNLENGNTVAAKGIINPQLSYGEDITTRMSNAIKSADDAKLIQKLAEEGVNQLATELCNRENAKTEDIVDAVIAGNTAMHHLLLGLPLKQLAYAPFLPVVSEPLDIKARSMGLHLAPGAYVHIFPNIAGFVGADHVAMLLAIDADRLKKPTIALDIGTNTEISLIKNGEITSVSCASGPAFEGGHIKFGMRAATGAIERLRIEGGKIEYQTMGSSSPVGICGSGIIDAIAQGYLAGIIDEGGRIISGKPLVITQPDGLEIVLADKKDGTGSVAMTQADIRVIQLAKAAVRTGIQVLLDSAGCVEEEVEQIIIAGAFGTYIDVSSAITIGMLPSLPLNRFKQVGNAAGAGARMALISNKKRNEARKLALKASYIEMATAPGFNEDFIQANYLGEYRIKKGRREKIT